jgi:hypothetical protein
MRKTIDFSKGIRGKYIGMKLEIVGEVKENPTKSDIWAVCVHEDKSLMRLKIYLIECKPNAKKVSVIDDNGEKLNRPSDWFLPLPVDKNTSLILQELVT